MRDANKIFNWTPISADEAKKIGFVELSCEDWKKSHHIRNDNSAQFKHENVKFISDDRDNLHALIFKDGIDKEYCVVIFVREKPWLKTIVHGIDILVDLVDEARASAMARGLMQRLYELGLDETVQQANQAVMHASRTHEPDPAMLATAYKVLDAVLADVCARAGVEVIEGKNNGG
jgi:hypothetical protein